MSSVYLAEETRYLTNRGLRRVFEFDRDIELAFLDRDRHICFTKDFEILSSTFETMSGITDYHFQGLISDSSVKYTCVEHLKLDKEPNNVQFKTSTGYSNILISKSDAIALTLFISTFFTKDENNKLMSIRDYNKRVYHVFKNVHDETSIYFRWNNRTSQYILDFISFYKEPDALERLLIDNLAIFSSILSSVEKYGYSMSYQRYKFVDFRNYKIASLFSLFLSITGYKSSVKFNKQHDVFRVTYTNEPSLLAHDYRMDLDETYISSKTTGYSVHVGSKNSSLLVSQNIEHITVNAVIPVDATPFSKDLINIEKPLNDQLCIDNTIGDDDDGFGE